ncbi:MAG: sodium:proton antiporter [Lachnospiraceae bacterium]|nr:sodium:proton antiporter [Lachnospiraceae bacterium]
MSSDDLFAAYGDFATVILVILGVIAVLILIRAITGPTAYDRLVSANMLGTVTMTMITVLLVKLQEGYLTDICLIYALISFLAVVVLSKVYKGAYDAKRKKKEGKNGNT